MECVGEVITEEDFKKGIELGTCRSVPGKLFQLEGNVQEKMQHL